MKFLIGFLILPAILLINSCSYHREYIGLPIEDAQKLARKRNLPNRIARADGDYGQGPWLTMDFIHNRLNFDVEKGKVVRVRRDNEGDF